jgi:hypothetical protein
MTLRTRKPTGAVPWPCLLIEGSEGSGKSYMAALLTASDRVGNSYWLEIGSEGTADEYGAIPGARYELIVHNGTWTDIMGQIEEVKIQARNALDAGEPPTVLIIDTMTAEWEMLTDWADNRARERENRKRANSNRGPVADDTGVTIGMDLWNDAKSRHRRLMNTLLTFPGIVVLLARAGEVAKVENGRPVENQRDYKVRGEKDLAYDATGWIRLDRIVAPQLIKLRSVHSGIRPGHDKPKEVKSLSLEWLIFDYMKCDPGSARVRDLVELKPGSDDPRADEVAEYRTRALASGLSTKELVALHAEVKKFGLLGAPVLDDQQKPTSLGDLIVMRGHAARDREQNVATSNGVTKKGTAAASSGAKDPRETKIAHLFVILKNGEITSDEQRHQISSRVLQRKITTWKELTLEDATVLVETLEPLAKQGPLAEVFPDLATSDAS